MGWKRAGCCRGTASRGPAASPRPFVGSVRRARTRWGGRGPRDGPAGRGEGPRPAARVAKDGALRRREGPVVDRLAVRVAGGRIARVVVERHSVVGELLRTVVTGHDRELARRR